MDCAREGFKPQRLPPLLSYTTACDRRASIQHPSTSYPPHPSPCIPDSLYHSSAPPRCSLNARFCPARTFSNPPRRRLLTAPPSPAALGLLLPPPLVAPGASPSSPAAPAPHHSPLAMLPSPLTPNSCAPAPPPAPHPSTSFPFPLLPRPQPRFARTFSNPPRRRLLTAPPSPAALGLLLSLIWGTRI